MKELIIKLLIAFLLGTVGVSGQDWQRVSRLSGYWKFAIGDNKDWASPDYNDEDWEEIKVPSSWENEGFHGYNGFAWYRKTFIIDENVKESTLYLNLGYIDDVDEVYLNGKLIGFSGSFPPNYETAYNAMRRYPVPSNLIDSYGKNTIAVRVYDSQLAGGIVSGDIGLYVKSYELNPQINLEGTWKFHLKDNKEWSKTSYEDTNWDDIYVPSLWESQGYKDYDGFAWYRKSFEVPPYLFDQKLVLILGKIDDLDEAYINGQKIGNTGTINDDPFFNSYSYEYAEFRGYFIPKGILKPGKNIVAVRVWDGYKDGGIYEGPIGIVSQEKYSDFWKKKKRKNIWEVLFGN